MPKRINKVLIALICLLAIIGCKKENNKSSPNIIKNNDEEKTEPVTEEETTIKDNPIDIGLYKNTSGSRNLIDKIAIEFPKLSDMIVFETYYTKENTFEGNQKDLWNKFKNKYENIEEYKIGYHIYFKTTDGEVNQTILNPQDVESFFNYIQIYLYDDINQNSSWYSHVSKEEVTDKTIFTSIKLTGSVYIDRVISPVILTVFTYKKEEISEENNYTGNNKYKIEINKK